jgi:adenine phosphoribosyltransferase
MDLGPYIRAVPDFPEPGILFRDITPLLKEPQAFGYVLDTFVEAAVQREAEVVVGIESRGFLFGAPLADRLDLPFVPVRKPGKLPAAHMSVEYSLEYGESQLDIHEDAIAEGQRCLLVDDLLATGGTARATAKLVELVHGVVVGLAFVIELEALRGRSQLGDYDVFSIVRY